MFEARKLTIFTCFLVFLKLGKYNFFQINFGKYFQLCESSLTQTVSGLKLISKRILMHFFNGDVSAIFALGSKIDKREGISVPETFKAFTLKLTLQIGVKSNTKVNTYICCSIFFKFYLTYSDYT